MFTFQKQATIGQNKIWFFTYTIKMAAKLHLLRTLWVTIAIVSLGLFLLSIPYHIIFLSGNLPLSLRIALMQADFSTTFYIAYELINYIVIVFGYCLIGIAIFLHKSNDLTTIFVSLAMVTFGVTVTSLESTTSPMNSLVLYWPIWDLPVTIIQIIGLELILLVFYLFPDGRFIPRWTRPLAYMWVAWLLLWVIVPAESSAPQALSPAAQFLTRMLMTDASSLHNLLNHLRNYSLGAILIIWFGSGIFAQIYRYLRVSTPAQRYQTKWGVFGLAGSMLIYFAARVLPPLIFPTLRAEPGGSFLEYELISLPIGTIALLLVPVTIGISIQRYRLWDVDFLINRTLVYGTLTAVIGLGYLLEVVALQFVFTKLTGNQSTLFIAVSTLIIAALFQPLYRWIQGTIDRRFFREKTNFRQVFTGFAREVRTIIDLPELLGTLVNRTTELLSVEYGAVYLQQPGSQFQISEAQNVDREKASSWQPSKEQLEKLQAGQAISQPKDSFYPMLVPLLAPQRSYQQADAHSLLGILALGSLRSGLHYSREDQALLLSLTDQAGTALYVARLIQETQEETHRRMEAEQHLEDHRNSPIGRAEILAQEIMQQPNTALEEIHQLTQRASKDPDSANLVGNLPKVLQNMEAGPIASLAEGYNYLYDSQFTPELCPIGLRTLINALQSLAHDERPESESARQALFEGLAVYRLCLQAYDANSAPQIMEIHGLSSEETPENSPLNQYLVAPKSFLVGLAGALLELKPVTEALHAYERVDNSQDKLAYLASAVNSLRHVDHLARTELGSADRPIIELIVESWLAIITNAMSDIQTSAHIACHLLTRNTWQEDIVSLVLSLTNQGRGAALKLRITLAPAPEYTLLDETALVERLAPGEEVQVQLRVQLRLPSGVDHFRARFILHFTDPRGPDQVENFADIVHLMATSGEFQFIPNPYVVGTPLKSGSPLFFGRDDIVKFIQDNLTASHRNNLVLIGQRRTGKTSLLKQLPARLGDDTLPVYLDGQTLGLDPGMSNFFLNLATEIAFALEDRGFDIENPELASFQASPANTFEHSFLPQVRQLIGMRHLLIMFDEFEELETAVKRGNLEPSVFGFLRHLIQHEPDLSVIFCGTHRLEQLAADYWSVLFNISLYQHIAFLQKEEALRLIQEPVSSYGMRYDDLALDKIWRVTAGHPYFLQLLCHSLVNHHNKSTRNYVTIADVNAALDDILASGEAHFVYLWTESSPEERLVLTALSRMIPLTGQASAAQTIDFFNERGISLDRQIVQVALHHLTLRDILQSRQEGDVPPGSQPLPGETYRWKLGLLGLWVEKYKSLSRVVDDLGPYPLQAKQMAP